MKKITIIILTLGMLISACSKDELLSPEQKDSQTIRTAPSLSTLSLSDKWQKGYYKDELIVYEKVNNRHLFLGDILIQGKEISDKPQNKTDRVMGAGLTGSYYLWPNKTMNYVIDPNTTETRRQWIITAIRHWSDATGFRFLDVTNDTNRGDYVYMVYGFNGNNSYVGRIGGQQILNLQNDGIGVIVHELGHALGMYHEQVRSDRDEYIQINWENIQEEWKPYFLQYSFADNVLVNAPETGFDYHSIMLYSSISSAAVNQSLPVMTKHNGDTWADNIFNGSNAPSVTDANWVKIRYQIP